MSTVQYPEGFSQSDLKITVKNVISNLQSFVDNLEDFSSLESVQNNFKASLSFALQNFSTVTQGLNYESTSDVVKEVFPPTWFKSANIVHLGKSKTTYPKLSQFAEEDVLIWQQAIANVHPMSSEAKWPSMYRNQGKWGTRNTKGTSTTASYLGRDVRKILAKLPPIKPVADSLVPKNKFPNYIDHIKTGPFYGPYLFSNCYAVM
jgi:hypothetical protein